MQVSLKTFFGPEAAGLLKQYESNSVLLWRPVAVKAYLENADGSPSRASLLVDRLEDTGDMKEGGYMQSFYPPKTIPEGTKVELSLVTDIETSDADYWYDTIGGFLCGETISAKDGWHALTGSPQNVISTITETATHRSM